MVEQSRLGPAFRRVLLSKHYCAPALVQPLLLALSPSSCDYGICLLRTRIVLTFRWNSNSLNIADCTVVDGSYGEAWTVALSAQGIRAVGNFDSSKAPHQKFDQDEGFAEKWSLASWMLPGEDKCAWQYVGLWFSLFVHCWPTRRLHMWRPVTCLTVHCI